MPLSHYSKAIVAAAFAAAQVAALWWPEAGLITEDQIERGVGVLLTVLSVASPFLVYAIPNRPS